MAENKNKKNTVGVELTDEELMDMTGGGTFISEGDVAKEYEGAYQMLYGIKPVTKYGVYPLYGIKPMYGIAMKYGIQPF